MKKNDYIKEGAKGVLTGASMLVPGISGGTMALIFGYYDRLINAAAGIFKNFKKNIFTILFYMITVAAGFVIFSWPMSFLLENFSFIMFCFFVGTIIGSLVLFKKKAMIEKFRMFCCFAIESPQYGIGKSTQGPLCGPGAKRRKFKS